MTVAAKSSRSGEPKPELREVHPWGQVPSVGTEPKVCTTCPTAVATAGGFWDCSATVYRDQSANRPDFFLEFYWASILMSTVTLSSLPCLVCRGQNNQENAGTCIYKLLRPVGVSQLLLSASPSMVTGSLWSGWADEQMNEWINEWVKARRKFVLWMEMNFSESHVTGKIKAVISVGTLLTESSSQGL